MAGPKWWVATCFIFMGTGNFLHFWTITHHCLPSSLPGEIVKKVTLAYGHGCGKEQKYLWNFVACPKAFASSIHSNGQYIGWLPKKSGSCQLQSPTISRRSQGFSCTERSFKDSRPGWPWVWINFVRHSTTNKNKNCQQVTRPITFLLNILHVRCLHLDSRVSDKVAHNYIVHSLLYNVQNNIQHYHKSSMSESKTICPLEWCKGQV